MHGINFVSVSAENVRHNRSYTDDDRDGDEGGTMKAVMALRFKNSKQTVDAATAELSGRASARLFSVEERCCCCCCLEPDESTLQTSVKHCRFQQDNELFCSGERFHFVSTVLTSEGGDQKNRERERGIETPPATVLPLSPSSTPLHAAEKFSLRCTKVVAVESLYHEAVLSRSAATTKPGARSPSRPYVPHYASYGEKFPAWHGPDYTNRGADLRQLVRWPVRYLTGMIFWSGIWRVLNVFISRGSAILQFGQIVTGLGACWRF